MGPGFSSQETCCPALDVVASRQTVGESLGAQVMLDTGNRMVETEVPFDDLPCRCVGAQEKILII